MDELSDLLLSENIDVSYFAAGIVAHLASDGPDQWDLKNHARDDMLEELKNAVTNWKVINNINYFAIIKIPKIILRFFYIIFIL